MTKVCYGLRTASPERIAALKSIHPNGVHVTHKVDGTKMPFNGVFYSHVTYNMRKWART